VTKKVESLQERLDSEVEVVNLTGDKKMERKGKGTWIAPSDTDFWV